MPEIKQTGRVDSHSQTTLLANGSGIPLVTGAAFSIFSLPIQTQEAILAAATDLIVSRGGSQNYAPAPSFTPPPANATHLAKEANQVPPQRMVSIVQTGHQLRKSVQSIRESLTKLESKVHDQIFDHERLIQSTKSASLRAQPSAAIAKTPPVASSSRNAVASPPASLRSRNESNFRRLDAAHTRKASPVVPSTQIESADLRAEDREQATGPKIWRRWVRLDRVLESQASRWQSQASRLGVIVHFRFDAPTGQEIWTDVDIVLHIVDQFVASMIGRGKRGSSVTIQVSLHPEDEHWMQIAVRGLGSESLSPQVAQLGNPAIFSVARKFATMLGGFLDQYVGQEQGVCLKFHFPIDDMLSWLHRAKVADQTQVFEIELSASHSEAFEPKHWMFADRAFQASMDPSDRVILIAPKRYLLTSNQAMSDLAKLKRMFQLQLDRIGGSVLAGQVQKFDLRCQHLGQIESILQRIHQRLKSEAAWSSFAPSGLPKARTTVAPRTIADTRPSNPLLHASHAAPSRPKLKMEARRAGPKTTPQFKSAN